MKITIESTDKIVELVNEITGDEMPARVWEGKTEDGCPVHVFVTRISPQTYDPEHLAQFERELKETRAPSPEVKAYDLRLIL